MVTLEKRIKKILLMKDYRNYFLKFILIYLKTTKSFIYFY